MLTAEPARAHLNLQPRLVERGEVTAIVVELPRLRPGTPPERLELEGREVEVLSSGLHEVAGSETRWNVRLRADSRPGTVALVLRAVYADGETVEVKDALTVVPAEDGSFPWVGVIVAVVIAAALAVVALRVARRITW